MNDSTDPSERRRQFSIRGLLWSVAITAAILTIAGGRLIGRLGQILDPVPTWGIRLVSVDRDSPRPSKGSTLSADFGFSITLAAEREFEVRVKHRRYNPADAGRPNFVEIARTRSHRQYVGHAHASVVRFTGRNTRVSVFDPLAAEKEIGKLPLNAPEGANSCSFSNLSTAGNTFASGGGNQTEISQQAGNQFRRFVGAGNG